MVSLPMRYITEPAFPEEYDSCEESGCPRIRSWSGRFGRRRMFILLCAAHVNREVSDESSLRYRNGGRLLKPDDRGSVRSFHHIIAQHAGPNIGSGAQEGTGALHREVMPIPD